MERWHRQPLFAGEPPHVGRLARADQRRNRPQALAAALRGLGTGEMAPLWGELPRLEMEATVVVGDRDHKFRAIGERMAAALPRGQLALVRADARAEQPAPCDRHVHHRDDDERGDLLRREMLRQDQADERDRRRSEQQRQPKRSSFGGPPKRVG